MYTDVYRCIPTAYRPPSRLPIAPVLVATFENLRLSSTEFFKTLNVELFMLQAVETGVVDPQAAFEFDNDC